METYRMSNDPSQLTIEQLLARNANYVRNDPNSPGPPQPGSPYEPTRTLPEPVYPAPEQDDELTYQVPVQQAPVQQMPNQMPVQQQQMHRQIPNLHIVQLPNDLNEILVRVMQQSNYDLNTPECIFIQHMIRLQMHQQEMMQKFIEETSLIDTAIAELFQQMNARIEELETSNAQKETDKTKRSKKAKTTKRTTKRNS